MCSYVQDVPRVAPADASMHCHKDVEPGPRLFGVAASGPLLGKRRPD